MSPVERLLTKLQDVTPFGLGWKARCPAHQDEATSLTIFQAHDGRAIPVCGVGCTDFEVCEAVGQSWADLMPTADSLPTSDRPTRHENRAESDRDNTGATSDDLRSPAEALHEPAGDDWPEIVPFDVLDLPAFPSHVLPDPLRDWVEAESHATQTPPDLAGLLSLAVCSACIARLVEVEPRPGWREPSNLYVTVVLESGNRKSAVFADAIRPLREEEAELVDAARSRVAHEQSRRRQDKLQLERLEKQTAEGGDEATRAEALALAAKLGGQSEPVLPRLIVDDVTSERLDMILAEQGGRIASMSPEGDVFDLMGGRYSKDGMAQVGTYLKGHSGDDLSSDRVGRGKVYVKRPAITCGYAVQSIVIKGLARNPVFRGRGLLGRFLYGFPRSWIGTRKIAPRPVRDAVRDAYHRIVRTLAGLDGQYILRLSAEATATFLRWETEVETMLGDGGQLELMRDWGGKLAGETLRLATVLHCVEHSPTEPIDARTIEAAIQIARYLIPHAEAVLSMMECKDGTRDADARYLLRWIERHGLREFTRRNAHQHGKRRFQKANDIDPALAELEERGYIRPRVAVATGRGRPASPAYDVNPAVFADAGCAMRSQNSHNSNGQPPQMGSENIEDASGQSGVADRVQVTI